MAWNPSPKVDDCREIARMTPPGVFYMPSTFDSRALSQFTVLLNAELGVNRQFRFPRSRRRRIRNKWAKRPDNCRCCPRQVYIMEQEKMIVCHPADWARLKREIDVEPTNLNGYPV